VQITHSAARPFSVVVDQREIRDIGTRFTVRKSNSDVSVAVMEGAVIIDGLRKQDTNTMSPLTLATNERVVFDRNGIVQETSQLIDSRRALLWTGGVLETRGELLPEVIAELNRYTIKPIKIDDRRLETSTVQVGGALHLTDIHSALLHLQKVAPIRVTETESAYILNYLSKGSSDTDRMVFAGEPIREIVMELNRAATKQILIDDPEQRFSNAQFGGTFDRQDVRGLLRGLELVFPVRVRETADAFILSYRPEPLPSDLRVPKAK